MQHFGNDPGPMAFSRIETNAELALAGLGGQWRVGAVLGEGGQGSVYALHPLAEGRRSLALKWYRPEASHPQQRKALLRLTEQAAPSEEFIWPLEVVDGPDGSFGYVMPILPASYVPLSALLTGKADASFSTVTRLCMGLADSFLKLHAQGLCYRDISLGNVFFDLASGRPLVCDNDNVGVDGRDDARVMGTSRFMAPEIVRGEAAPSTATDLYSLAVLIFYVLMVHHPLQGRRELEFECFDRDAETLLFGQQPKFVFDPLDDSNAPDPTVHATVLQFWPLYPPYIRSEFVQAFTAGLTDPKRRVREGMWRSKLSRLLDGIAICPCGKENFTDDGAATTCWACGTQIPPPVCLDIAGRILVLNPGTRLTRHHLRRDYDYASTLGEVAAHPTRPGAWGLRNLSDTPWRVRLPTGTEIEVAPERSVGLVAGTEIEIGGTVLTIRG
jgi:DNA-binding helix-hairpin-helix protein with protein kinase domain